MKQILEDLAKDGKQESQMRRGRVSEGVADAADVSEPCEKKDSSDSEVVTFALTPRGEAAGERRRDREIDLGCRVLVFHARPRRCAVGKTKLIPFTEKVRSCN